MNNRTVVTILLALVLIALVMCVFGALSLTGWVGTEKVGSERAWSYPYPAVQSMKIIDLTGDGKDDLFLQNDRNVTILDSAGQPLANADYRQGMVSTMGDVDGDGVEDVVVFSGGGPQAEVMVISKNQGQPLAPEGPIGSPARTAVVHFTGGTQIILGDNMGLLVGVSPQGQTQWYGNIGGGNETRGLDDALVKGAVFLAAANRDGQVGLFDERGQQLWDYYVDGGLRRLRAYDLDGDGTGEVVLGGENGQFVILDAATGSVEASASVGQTVTEIREAEANGDPSSREVVVGGKDGGVWVFDAAGKQLWSRSMGERVTEIAAVDLNGDGADEVIIGDEGGDVTIYVAPDGESHPLLSMGSGIARLDAGKLSGPRQLAAADQNEVRLENLQTSSAPALKFTPLLVGLIISALIAGVAWFIATNPPKPAVKLTIEDQSAESLLAQRRMLKENIADVERLKAGGEMTSEAYMERLKELRGQLADNDTAMRKTGVEFKPQTFACPHCGGTLELGVDRCDYCGQIILH